MSAKSPTTSKSRNPWFSRFKKHVSSAIAPRSGVSPSRLPGNSTGSLSAPAPRADAGVPPRLSVSSAPIPSTTNPILSPPPQKSSPSPHPPRSANYIGNPNAPDHHVDNEPSSASVCHRPSVSSCFAHSMPDPILSHQSPALSLSPTDSPSRQYNTERLHLLGHDASSSSPTSSPASLSHQPVLSGDNAGGLDEPVHPAVATPSPAPIFHPASASSVSAPSTTNQSPARPNLGFPHPTRHVEDSALRNSSSPHLATSAPPKRLQERALNYQGGTHIFGESHDFVMNDTTFIENHIVADSFMKELLQETIIGAEFDSSARDPPPRCHPGTRLAIIQRCQDFIAQCNNEEKLRWVFGPAGVGKSAVMQMVLETASNGVIFASIFLSVNGRRNGTKVILTIAYQLAVKCDSYRQFIRDQVSLDPSLLRKSLSVQFKKFIIEPFMHRSVFEPSLRFFIVIDGLDECNDRLTQQALLGLITDFCITYPTSPIAWIVASRPEPHITSFFDNPKIRSAYTKEEMVIDSDEACDDVQRYLREELNKIKLARSTLRQKREWPLEHEFTKIASAAGGLFAYAATVIRYIGYSTRAGPAAQLRRVLETIDANAKDHLAGSNHPMAQLDALYKRILSNVPDNVMINTRKLLLLLPFPHFNNHGFRAVCNMLGLTEDDAYDAVSPLHAVLKVPKPDKADDQLEYYHKSFGDFLRDFKRSGFFHDESSEGYQVADHTSLKIIEEVQENPNGVGGGEDIMIWRGSGQRKCFSGNISLSWPGDECLQMTDKQMMITLYGVAMSWINTYFCHPDSRFMGMTYFHVFTTRFTIPPGDFPYSMLRKCAFDQFRDELVKLGKLKQVPLRTLDYAAVCGVVDLLFTSPTGSEDRRVLSCEHEAGLDGIEQYRRLSTWFRRYYEVESDTETGEDTDIPRFHILALQEGHRKWSGNNGAATGCIHCSRRFARHFMNNADQLATVFVDSTRMCYVEVSFVDPDDGVSEWRYQFLHSGPPTSIDG